MNRRNIMQYKPEGVANIFSPTIRIHGQTQNSNKSLDASNSDDIDNSYVNYPRQETVTSQRQGMTQQNATQDNYDDVYHRLFGNLLSTEYTPDDNIYGDLLAEAGAPIPADMTQTEYQRLATTGLKTLADCIEKGGNCVHKDNCETDNKIGDCFWEV